MYKFTYQEYKNCWFSINRYPNGNIALEIWQDDYGPIVRVTVNPGVPLPEDYLAVKDYSENKGMTDFLQRLDIIVDAPVMSIPSGHVWIHVYRLTEFGKEILKIS